MKLARSRNLIHLIPIRLEAVDSEGFDLHRRVTVPGYRWSQQASITDTPMPKKSIYRQPGAQHFQLVHRSQRDPLIHDPEASQHVLKPFERENVRKVLRTTISLMQCSWLNYIFAKGKDQGRPRRNLISRRNTGYDGPSQYWSGNLV